MIIEQTADLIAEAVRLTYDAMSVTDKTLIQAAILRGQRKVMAKQIRDLKVKAA